MKEVNVAVQNGATKGQPAKGEQDWKNISDTRNSLDNKLENILKYTAIGAGGLVGIASVGLIAVHGLSNITVAGTAEVVEGLVPATGEEIATVIGITGKPVKTIDISLFDLLADQEKEAAGPITTEITEAVENGATKGEAPLVATSASKDVASKVSSTGLTVMKGILVTTIVIAVIALIVSLVFYFLNHAKDNKPTYMQYTAVPGILCHKQDVYDISKSGTRTKAKNQGYVYYYGATNPYTVTTRAKFGNDDDNTLKLGENKRNVQDIFNWELGEGKNREWVCLYYTKDPKAGFPITTSSLKINTELGTKVEGATSFNKVDKEYNFNYILKLNYLDDRDLISDTDDIMKLPKTYLHFKMNTRALAKPSSSTGSAVSNPTFWSVALIALVLGFGGGFLAFYYLDKKKKELPIEVHHN